MATKSNSTTFEASPKIKRTGVHAKAKTSSLKESKNYKKIYRGQGK